MCASHAFAEGDYPDRRSGEERAAERTATVEQIAGLERLKAPELMATVVGRLQQRRATRPRRTRFETVRTDSGTVVLVAAGSVVARAERVPDEVHAALTKTASVTHHRCRRLDVTRSAGDGRPMTQIAADLCRDLGGVGVNHVLPLAGHIKGGGGPEPSSGARRFGEVWFPRLRPSPVIAVLDTGVSAERRSDEFLAMRVEAEDVDPLDELGRRGYLDAAAGHGAFVAGIVQQVAPPADLRIYRVVDSDGITTDTDLAELMRTAIADGATILNLSLGTVTVDGQPPPAVADVVQQNPDVLFVCAAGNGGTEEPVWPGAMAGEHANVVSVAALTAAGEPASWSSRGTGTTFSTVGEGVVSTYVEGREDGTLVDDPSPDEYRADSWALWTGTSFAAPQITGALARIIMSSDGDLTPAEAVAVLQRRGAAPEQADGFGTRVLILPGT